MQREAWRPFSIPAGGGKSALLFTLANSFFYLMISFVRTLYAVLVVLLMASVPSMAQDKIVKINNDTIRAKVVKITTDKIIYRYPGTHPIKLPEIAKNMVKEIIYANGSKLKILYDIYAVASELYVSEQRHAVKMDVGALFLNHFTLGFEFAVKTGMNIELKAGIIGPGLNGQLDEAEGFLVKAGVKFIKCDTSYSKGRRYLDPLKGSYFKPEFLYSTFTTEKNSQDVRCTNYALNFVLGKQFIPGKWISLEFFGGLGLGLQSSTYVPTSVYDKGAEFSYVYSHVYFGKELPVIVSGGITAGFAF
jgi:hypothetical protein